MNIVRQHEDITTKPTSEAHTHLVYKARAPTSLRPDADCKLKQWTSDSPNNFWKAWFQNLVLPRLPGLNTLTLSISLPTHTEEGLVTLGKIPMCTVSIKLRSNYFPYVGAFEITRMVAVGDGVESPCQGATRGEFEG